MEPEEPTSAFQFDDPRQREVYEKLRRDVSPGTASFWKDACALMAGHRGLATASHLVSHCLREVESAVRHVVLEISKEHLEPPEKDRKHEAEVNACLKGLRIAADDPAARFWLMLADPDSEMTLWKYAHRPGLDQPRPIDEDFRSFFARATRFFRHVLQRFEENFLKVFRKVLDDLLGHDSPTENDIKTLRQKIPQNRVALGYFFDRLPTARWIKRLKEAEFFANPPAPLPEGDTLRFFPWPAARYLARMAAVDPDAVVATIKDIPETENYVVHWHLLDAVLAMPPTTAAGLVDQACGWVGKSYSLGIAKRARQLVEHLIHGGEVDAAVTLASAMFDLSGDDEITKRTAKGFGTSARHEYEQNLAALNLPLAKGAGAKWIESLAGFLSDAIRLDREPDSEDREDWSSVWCKAIERDEHPVHGLKVLLVAALRDASEAVIREHPDQADKVFDVVRGGPYGVFERLELHLLRRFPQGRENRIREILGDRAAYDGRHREYQMLLASQFPGLPPNSQKQYLAWVRQDSEVGEDEEDAAYRERLKLRRLSGLRDALPPDWRTEYDELAGKQGSPLAADYATPRATASFVGPESPKSLDELNATSPEDLHRFLREWRPDEGARFGEPSSEGLGSVLEQVVAGRAGQFADAAESFRDLAPTYVRHILSGLRTACTAKAEFNWRPVLALCQWVMDQEVTFDREADHLVADKGWNWTQEQVARLLQAGLSPDNAEVPFEFWDATWQCIEPLTDSPDPTPEREARSIQEHRQIPCDISINSVRGGGIELVLRYAWWFRRHLEQGPDAQDRAAEGFAGMGKVREVLDRHLDVDRDPSLAIRSLYGQWFSWLARLDEEWARDNVCRIFPLDAASADYLRVAWDTYIVMNRPDDNVYRLLEEHYSHAVESLDRPKEDLGHLGNPDTSLTEHLVVLYAWGVVSDGDSIWQRFWNQATENVRGTVIWFTGRIFCENDDLPREHAARLKSMVEWRLGEAEKSLSEGQAAPEWARFGWWFEAKALADDWLLAQLERVLRVTRGKVDPDLSLLERLPLMAASHPRRVLECTRTIIESDREGWAVVGQEKEITQIIKAALESGEDDAERGAKDFVNYLASSGFPTFGDLLEDDK